MTIYYQIEKPEAEKTAENRAYEKEANTWAALYLLYDNDEASMDEAFFANGICACDSITLHRQCLLVAKLLLELNFDGEYAENIEDCLRPYFREAKALC